MKIRRANISESELLTQLSFASKGYWGYPSSYFELWAGELTISLDYIKENDVFVCEDDSIVVGYYSMIQLHNDIEVSGIKISKGFWLEHMFVEPRSIGKGIGIQLFDHLRQRCKCKGITKLGVLSDPNAKGFYENMGCTYLKEYPSTIKNRTTPYLVLSLVPYSGKADIKNKKYSW